MKDENPNAFKNIFNKAYLFRLANSIKEVHPKAEIDLIINLEAKMKTLELKERVKLVSKALEDLFPNFSEGIPVFLNAVETSMLSGFDIWPITQYIEVKGLDNFELSMKALYYLTQKFTAEFAIRPFLIRYEYNCLNLLSQWAEDSNHHVRRLVSEGTRPRLPWGQRLNSFIKNPTPTLELIEKLKYDSELYVRKSVANHLNDIAKDHPQKVIETLIRWNEEAVEVEKKKIEWITKHALRTLIKAGHPEALYLIGTNNSEGKIKVSPIQLKQAKIALNDKLEFNFTVVSLSSDHLKLVIDFIIHHRKANGGTREKVFKLKTCTLAPGETMLISKKHAVKPISTRTYYPGEHWLEIQINGSKSGKMRWMLEGN